MSSTGRGADYRPLGAYQTAIKDCRGLVRLLAPILATPQIVMEPSVGDGNFLTAIMEHERLSGVQHRLCAVDLDGDAPGLRLAHERGGVAIVGDFLTFTPSVRPTLIVANPPFAVPGAKSTCPKCLGRKVCDGRDGPKPCDKCGSARKGPTGIYQAPPVPCAERHVRRMLDLVAPGGTVAVVLRLAFSETEDRIPFWRQHGTGKGLVSTHGLARRLSFMGGPTDSSAYGFFCWRRGYAGRAEFLPGFDHLDPSSPVPTYPAPSRLPPELFR